jgi:hypothetical protein
VFGIAWLVGVGLGRRRFCAAGLVAAVVALASPGVASAACTDSWKGPAEGGTWQTASNWSAEHAPGSTDVACIGAADTVTVADRGVVDDGSRAGV